MTRLRSKLSATLGHIKLKGLGLDYILLYWAGLSWSILKPNNILRFSGPAGSKAQRSGPGLSWSILKPNKILRFSGLELGLQAQRLGPMMVCLGLFDSIPPVANRIQTAVEEGFLLRPAA
ncbi:hypothetical protein SDJN02_09007, partial [Cucurbita argyrosperma subsp. argyrosperma]